MTMQVKSSIWTSVATCIDNDVIETVASWFLVWLLLLVIIDLRTYVLNLLVLLNDNIKQI